MKRFITLVTMFTLITLLLSGLPAWQVTIEGIGKLSFETSVTLSVGQEVAYASPDWVSPTGHNELDNNWDSETNAYDDKTNTWATTKVTDSYLELTLSDAINCNKVRIYAATRDPPETLDSNIDIDVYYGGSYHNIFSGTITKETWVEKEIGSLQSVTKARVKWNSLPSGGSVRGRLCEFDFWEVPPPSEVWVVAEPINVTADGSSTSTITATVNDEYGDPVADGTNVTFTTDHGTFSSDIITKTTTGGVATATLTSESSTETIIATVIASANGVLDATAVFFIPEGGVPVVESKTEIVTDSGTVMDTPTGGDVSIDATGDHIITVARYEDNPVGAPTFQATGDYYDVHLYDDSYIDSLTIGFCPATADTVIYYWNGTSWSPASDQSYSDGCIVVTITDSTQPRLSDLTGLVFASGTSGVLPPTVGGKVYPINKASALMPWVDLALVLILAVGGGTLTIRKRRI